MAISCAGADHGVVAAAIGPLQHPFRMEEHHIGVSRFHQTKLKPRDHPHVAAMGRLREMTDGIKVGESSLKAGSIGAKRLQWKVVPRLQTLG